jgi:hypothetical protein
VRFVPDDEVERLLTLARRKQFFAGLTPPQLKFIRDPAKRKTARCSRRAGKTYAVGADLVADGLRYPDPLAYIGLTRLSAKKILWDELVKWNASLGLEIEFNISELTATFPGHAKLFVGGADTPRDIERWRGMRFRKIVIDEAGSFGPHIKTLIEEVLSPTLMDLDGVLSMTGTPTASCRGIFHDADVGALPGWSAHHWTWHDNPHVSQTWVAEEMTRRGITEHDPIAQREFYGRWHRGDGRLVYKYTDDNLFDGLPEASDWTYLLGVDLGYWDDCAFAVGAYSSEQAALYIVDQFKRPKMTVDQVGAMIAQLDQQYDIVNVVMDTGGLGKTIAETLNERGGLPTIIPAMKTEKMAHVAMFNGDLHKGIMKVRRGSAVTREWDELQFTEDGKEDPTQPNHLSDAVLYAWRHGRQFLHEQPAEGPSMPPELARMDSYRDKLVQRIERKREDAKIYDKDTEDILKSIGL